MFITETWLRDKGDEPLINERTPRNYLFRSFPRKDKPSGIGLLVREAYWSNVTKLKSGQDKTFQSIQISLKR